MKKILILFLVFVLFLSILTSCSEEAPNGGGEVMMIARIEAIGDKIEVMVTESEYSFGTHLVITSETTQYIGKQGKKISRSDLSVGQTVEIIYSGQIMLSYPPQIVAKRITVK